MRLVYALRYDIMDHWPKPISEVPCVECKEETNIPCKKCQIALCLNRGRNCFIMYHTPPKGKIICSPKFAPPLAFVPYEESSTSERELSSDSESDLDHSESDLDHSKSDLDHSKSHLVHSKSDLPHPESDNSDPCISSTSH